METKEKCKHFPLSWHMRMNIDNKYISPPNLQIHLTFFGLVLPWYVCSASSINLNLYYLVLGDIQSAYHKHMQSQITDLKTQWSTISVYTELLTMKESLIIEIILTGKLMWLCEWLNIGLTW